MPAELHWPAVNENFRGAAADSQMLSLTLAGASEHETYEARLQCSFFTRFHSYSRADARLQYHHSDRA
jgi:hypothetical protein